MSKATDADASRIERILGTYAHLAHLRVRRRGAVLTVESGPEDDPVPHVRFRRISASMWTIQMPNHRGRWEPTGINGPLDELVQTVVRDFSWTLAPIWNPDGS